MHKLVLALAVAFAAACCAMGQEADSLLRARQANFDRFAARYPQERVYLHFDNTSYYKGERIWYKAYVVDGGTFRATPLSRILYVELLNPMGYPVETQKLVISDGQADGAFTLSDTINAGFYEVRAYTAWMLNFTPGDRHGWRTLSSRSVCRRYGERFQRYLDGNAGVFSRVFPVYDAVEGGRYAIKRMPRQPKATVSLLEREKDRLLIDFYPEGGNIVEGVPTRVAFQARNTAGRTLNVAGELVRRGKSVGYFKTDYAGRGVFAVGADDTQGEELADRLRLKLTYGGRDYTFSLPQPRSRGYVLGVLSSPERVRATVARNAATEGMELGLSVTCRGRTAYCGVVDLRRDLSAAVDIDAAALPTGVNVVTLFSPGGKVVAQRMVFVNNHDVEPLRLAFDVGGADSLRPYGRVEVGCSVAAPGGRRVGRPVSFAMAVTDAAARDVTYDDGNALSYLLLSSEIKGFVPHPAYYFEADDADHRAALDVLMMVQGWTRYDFERMMDGSPLAPMPEAERALVFRGRVLDDRSDLNREAWRPVRKNLWVYSELAVGNGDIYYGECKVDSGGVFAFTVPPFFGKGRLSLVLNRDSLGAVGQGGDIAGHNYDTRRNYRPGWLMGRHIEPLNAWSPLPKDYSYYETATLNEPWDANMFSRFMAAPARRGRYVSYDTKSGSWLVDEIVKSSRRRWANFRDVRPACVTDVDELMTWLSNIMGDVSQFRFNQELWLGGTDYLQTVTLQRGADRYLMHPNYDGLREMLYIFGLDGMNRTLINADSLGIGNYRKAFGTDSLLPRGVKFFPHDENFRQLRLYADVADRRLTYQAGGHRERVYPYRPPGKSFIDSEGLAEMDDTHPLTSIFNFITDDRYKDGSSLPEFMGYRINFQGINRPAEFYLPDYSRMPLPEQTDYRRTVYWNPNVTTDADGRATVSFYNNGFSDRLAVSAGGITPDGVAIVQ